MRNKIIILLVSGLALFTWVSVARSAQEKKARNDLFRQVGLFSDTLAIIETDYADETKPKDLIYGALKGMLSSLDAHSQFLDPESFSDLRTETEGKFGGLGLEITLKDGMLTVITPIEDTPAWKAGIKAGDRIVKIGDEITRDMALMDAVKKMRGKPGQKVHITVLRESQKKLLDFNITRDIIRVKDIKEARILEGNIGYIRLVEFRENTGRELDIAFENLAKRGMNALVLDLRNNPGGLLDVAVKVCGKFIEKKKLIVYTKSRKKTQNLEFFSKEEHPNLSIPIVVLINEGSASGSEIVAGCLQDYKRALIVGAKSFGKGSVQTVIPLVDGSALRLTTSKYYTPLGREIHGKGISPDIEVDGYSVVAEEKRGDAEAEVFERLEKAKKPKPVKEGFRKDDAQLARAVDILKALQLYKENAKK